MGRHPHAHEPVSHAGQSCPARPLALSTLGTTVWLREAEDQQRPSGEGKRGGWAEAPRGHVYGHRPGRRDRRTWVRVACGHDPVCVTFAAAQSGPVFA